ncbi:tetratricopeptide repeat protein 1 [Nematostella vectensis]|uniref:tetratricopeptide repeat protein 1 n=1 Tax=Nematostella vectensis TaxID=45351 RepID=UPI0020773C54|nr:tetratricopeptide repeat protein 1 [Nematostella vectensis]
MAAVSESEDIFNKYSDTEKTIDYEQKAIKKDVTETAKGSTSVSSEQKQNESDDDGETFEDAKENIAESSGVNENLKGCNIADDTENTHDENDSDEEYVEPEEDLTPEQKEERKQEAIKLKDQGNESFRNSEFPKAKELYTMAITQCPSEFKNEKSIFYSNRAACLARMEFYKDAIKDCTKALELNPEYLKARLRRAQCYEKTDELEEALEDYKLVFEANKSCEISREALMRLPEQIKIKHEKMKEEMLGKLKDLGNVFLKPFGLSTNNFQFQQDPNTGGYSVNFTK